MLSKIETNISKDKTKKIIDHVMRRVESKKDEVAFRKETSGALLGGVKRSFRAVRIASFNEISSHLPSEKEILITNPLSI
jgi:hypothetical protein